MGKFSNNKKDVKENNSNSDLKNDKNTSIQLNSNAFDKEKISQSLIVKPSTNNIPSTSTPLSTSSKTGVSNSISASITQDLLNNIDLNNVKIRGDKSLLQKQANFDSKGSKTRTVNRLSMPGLASEKRLASEGIEYDPVFK